MGKQLSLLLWVTPRRIPTLAKRINAEHEAEVLSFVGDKKDSNIGVEIDSQEGETNGERNSIEKDREDAKMEEPNAFSIDETEEDTSKVDEKKEDAVEKNETSKKSDTGLPDEHVPEKQEDEPVLRKEDQGKILKKSNQPNGDPLLGATAYVYQGVFKGLSGTITLV